MNLNINVGNQRPQGLGCGGKCGRRRNPMLGLMKQMLRLMQQMLNGGGRGRGGCPCHGGFGQPNATNININVGNQFRGYGF